MKCSRLFVSPTTLLLACFFAGISFTARGDLEQDLKTLLQNAALRKAELGVQIVLLGDTPQTTRPVFRHNADIPLIPASNLKIVTTAAAVAHLGPEFKFRTMLLKRGNDLILVGDGDPTLGDAEMLRKIGSGWDVTTVFRNWGEALAKHGLTKFDRLLVDDGVFDQEFFHPNWPIDQAHRRYEHQVAGLNLNVNCADFHLRYTSPGELVTFTTNPPTKYITVQNTCTSGGDNAIWLSRIANTNDIILKGRTPGSTGENNPLSVTVHDPSMFTATVLAETFDSSGVSLLNKNPVRDRTIRAQLAKVKLGEDPAWTVLAVHETPLQTVLARANKDSVNLYAEALCKRIGAQNASDQPGSWKTGNAAIGAWLVKIGVPSKEFRLDDGCGLSKVNAISSNALCQVLASNYQSKTTREFFASTLSAAGKDGTLENRFGSRAMLDLRGRIFGKSGFVNGVSTLSGYVRAGDDQWYAFSILMNNCHDIAAARAIQEQIIRAIDQNSAPVANANGQ
jgi:D-alanyl-D-alanine carboxypeptidase/D-alanyl-D-alanine-endopeptidase (penicillin-binding protein 4)